MIKIIEGELSNNYGDSGYDIHSNISGEIYPSERLLISTGLKVAIDNGNVGIIKPRSGLAVNNGIDVLAGVIDPSYRGEVKVSLINHGAEIFRFNRGDRVAQLIVIPCFTGKIEYTDVDETERGNNGFGSTGK